MYVSGSADWAKQKNSKEKGHCFILMSNAPFYGLIRLSYAQAHHQYFLISLYPLLIKVPPLNLRQDGRVMGLLLFTVFLRGS